MCRLCGLVLPPNIGLCRLRKVALIKTMAYRRTNKRRKLWSERANAKQARERSAREDDHIEIDPYIRIEIYRRQTDEKAVFECYEGTRSDNYSVYCNGVHQGIQSMTTLTKNIRKALPAFKSEW